MWSQTRMPTIMLFDIAIEPLAEMLQQSPLTGFKTPEMTHRIVVTLFADDTMVYLSKYDDIQVLLDILKTWCTASTAKFNIAKTEVVPMGPEDYRIKVITTRKLHEEGRSFPDSMRIAKEGKAKRFLGAWIRNNVDQDGVWAPTQEKINAALKRWELLFPTVEGRRIILQWTVAGMTQYLADVQGMPHRIESLLDKQCREFAWDNTGRSLVNTETMKQAFSKGGKKVPNIKDRNDAITLAQVRDFLATGENERPWAPFMRAILAHYAAPSPKTAPEIRFNPLLQDWHPTLKKLPQQIEKMLHTAAKYGVKLEIVEVQPEQVRAMPAWSHPAMTPEMCQLQNGMYAEYLHKKHKIHTIGDLEIFAASREGHPNPI